MLFSPCTSIRLTPAPARRLHGRSLVPPPASSPICSFGVAGGVFPDLSQHNTSR